MERDLDAFRSEVRSFLKEKLSPVLAERSRLGFYLSKEELFGWQQELFGKGWMGVNWPKEYGGPGWSPMQKYIFEDECAKAGAPILIMLGLNQVAALLIGYGTEAQKKRYLPSILDGTETWCQGFSEPGSGSDLASLKCAAIRDGDHYVVNGTKIWTTVAHWSDWCFLLVRTDNSGRKQDGITILLMDMKLPGITIRPIIGLDGMHSLNQLYLDNVRIPVAQRVGEEGRGWDLMKVVLGTERISAAGIWKAKAHFERLCAIAKTQMSGGRPLIERPRFRQRLAWLNLRLRALEEILLGVIEDPDKMASADSNILKLHGTQLQQELLEMISEAAGYYSLPFDPDVMREGWGDQTPIGPDFAVPATPFYFFWRKSSISGGANEIMRNMIAHTLLG
jgi:alkylation response protein AidB-like acyl-CoA dehydrogenase